MASSKKLTWKRVITYLFVLTLLAFARPFPLFFWIGFFLSLSGEMLRLWACGYLKKNRELATSGPYAHLKHPLYLGTFLGFFGLLVAITHLRPPGSYLALTGFPFFLAVFFFYYLPKKNRTEKDRMLRRFGQAFVEWDREVPDFLPCLRPFSSKGHQPFFWKGIIRNNEHSMLFVFLAGWTLLLLRMERIF